jgi:hypothetical protein
VERLAHPESADLAPVDAEDAPAAGVFDRQPDGQGVPRTDRPLEVARAAEVDRGAVGELHGRSLRACGRCREDSNRQRDSKRGDGGRCLDSSRRRRGKLYGRRGTLFLRDARYSKTTS